MNVDDRLVELANLFIACREAYNETSERFHWNPEPGSPAAQAAVALLPPDLEFSASRGESGHQLIAGVVKTYLLTASGHLGGLASLYTSGETQFSPPILVRAIIENCARALWVLGDDPDEPSEYRLARAYLEELLSAEEAKKNAGRMHSKTGSSYMLADSKYRMIKRQIFTQFPQTNAKELGDWILNGQALLRPENSVVWMYALTKRHGGVIGERAASGIYGYLSNWTHPTLYVVRQRSNLVDGPAVDHRVDPQDGDVDSVANAAMAALAAFYNALNYTTSYFGWHSAVVDDLTARIAGPLPAFFL